MNHQRAVIDLGTQYIGVLVQRTHCLIGTQQIGALQGWGVASHVLEQHLDKMLEWAGQAEAVAASSFANNPLLVGGAGEGWCLKRERE